MEQIRGVDSSYSVSALLTKKLIEDCGRLNVPGRPILYRTTPDFLRTFALSSLDELPEIDLINFKSGERQLEMEAMIQAEQSKPAEAPAETEAPAEAEAQ